MQVELTAIVVGNKFEMFESFFEDSSAGKHFQVALHMLLRLSVESRAVQAFGVLEKFDIDAGDSTSKVNDLGSLTSLIETSDESG